MDWVNNFFVPLFGVIFMFIVLLGLFIISIRAWNKRIKLWFKYCFRIPKIIEPKDIDEKDTTWIYNSSKTHSRGQLEMFLLTHNYNRNRIQELLFLYDLLKKNGGLDHVKKTERDNREAKRQLPTISPRSQGSC